MQSQWLGTNMAQGLAQGNTPELGDVPDPPTRFPFIECTLVAAA